MNLGSNSAATPRALVDDPQHYELAFMRELLDHGGIGIACQPIVNLRSPRVVGWEALLRGTHPHLGPIPPVVLVEAALAHGLLDELTQQVIEQALAVAAQATGIVDEPLLVTANIELEQLYVGDRLLDWLKRHPLPDRVGLMLEISERGGDDWTPMHERAAAELYDRGITLGIDDYGSGSDRFGFLRRRVWDLIKLDQRYLRDHGDRDRQVLELFVDMVHNLGMPTLAEGVETPADLVWAQSMGIDYGQGYWLGRPLTPADLLDRLRRDGLDVEVVI